MDSSEVESVEADGELQLVTECWIEPQNGVVIEGAIHPERYVGLNYKQIAELVSVDLFKHVIQKFNGFNS